MTVFLTTQYMEEADRLADRIALLDRGAIVAEGIGAELKAAVGGQRVVLRCADEAAYGAIERRIGAWATQPDRSALTIAIAYEADAAESARCSTRSTPTAPGSPSSGFAPRASTTPS